MKYTWMALLIMAFSFGSASAQEFTAPANPDIVAPPGISPDGDGQQTKPDPRKSVPLGAPAKPFGIFISFGQQGLVMVSPTAPASLGYGGDFLTETNQQQGFDIITGTAAGEVPYGGLVLFGWKF